MKSIFRVNGNRGSQIDQTKAFILEMEHDEAQNGKLQIEPQRPFSDLRQLQIKTETLTFVFAIEEIRKKLNMFHLGAERAAPM